MNYHLGIFGSMLEFMQVERYLMYYPYREQFTHSYVSFFSSAYTLNKGIQGWGTSGGFWHVSSRLREQQRGCFGYWVRPLRLIWFSVTRVVTLYSCNWRKQCCAESVSSVVTAADVLNICHYSRSHSFSRPIGQALLTFFVGSLILQLFHWPSSGTRFSLSAVQPS